MDVVPILIPSFSYRINFNFFRQCLNIITWDHVVVISHFIRRSSLGGAGSCVRRVVGRLLGVLLFTGARSMRRAAQ
jgi:hypothetical protein